LTRHARKVSLQQLPLFDVLAPPAPLPELPPPAVDEASRRAARELETDLVLRAGAGTGKTHTLVAAVTHLVAGATRLGRVPAGEILVLTFSEKAAGELRERVRAAFAALAEKADPLLEQAVRRAGAARPSPAEWRAAATLAIAAPITTFHGHAAAILRRHAAAARLDPGFTILDEDEATVLFRARAEEALLAALDEDPALVAPLVRELDFARAPWARGRALVEHVIAVAEKLREEGRAPASLLAHDDRAEARSLREQAAAAYLAALDDLVAALAGKGSAGVRARHAELAGLRPQIHALGLLDLDLERDPAELPPLARAREVMKGGLGNDERNRARDRAREAEALLRRAHVAHRAAPLAAAFAGLVERALAAYQAAKESLGALDFADLVARALDLLERDPAAREAEAERHRAVLVDELQDTNDQQDRLVELVRRPGAPLLAVGDPKQSIYEFRGADVSVFGRVAARVQAGGGRVLALTESRRGLAPLTDLVNRLFARTLRGGAHDFEVAFDPAADALHPHRGGDGVCVELLGCPDAEREPQAVARRLRALLDAGTRPGDVAVLFRRFTHLERFLGELRACGVPHYVVNGRGFYEAQEVRDLVNALTLVGDPHDPVATLGVLRSPLCGLSDPALVALARAMGGRLRFAPLAAPDFVVPDELDEGERARLASLVALMTRLAAHADRLGAGGILRALLEETDLAAVLATTHHGEQRVANAWRLVALAAAHDAEGRGDRTTLARRLRAQAGRARSLAAPAQIVGERDDVVRVMTVHQAKGLEFPVVLVPECGATQREPSEPVVYDRAAGLGLRLRMASGERVPTPRAERAQALRLARAAAESARIFYVAATRARDRLILSGPPSPGQAPTWRREIDALLAEDARARELVVEIPFAAARPPAPAPAPPRIHSTPATELPPSASEPPARARLLVAPVTELADLAACPRRHHFLHDLALDEPPAFAPGDAPAQAVLRLGAAARGTLAHRLLETVDLAAHARAGGSASALRAAITALGESPDDPEVGAVAARVRAFLDAPFGRALCARAASVRREVPFAYAVERPGAPRLLVKGQMDLVLDEGDRLTVLDYKHSRPGDAPPGAYRLQLLTYAAAARAIWGRPARVGLVYLRAAEPAPVLLDLDDAALDGVAGELAALATTLARGRQLASHDGVPLERCQALRCGFIPQCHGSRSD
jgi:ATP-dependent helicase/nuclease subunit A